MPCLSGSPQHIAFLWWNICLPLFFQLLKKDRGSNISIFYSIARSCEHLQTSGSELTATEWQQFFFNFFRRKLDSQSSFNGPSKQSSEARANVTQMHISLGPWIPLVQHSSSFGVDDHRTPPPVLFRDTYHLFSILCQVLFNLKLFNKDLGWNFQREHSISIPF